MTEGNARMCLTLDCNIMIQYIKKNRNIICTGFKKPRADTEHCIKVIPNDVEQEYTI